MKEVFNGLEEQKTAWDTTDAQLRAERAAMDEAGSTADQDAKDAKDAAIAAHQDTKQGLIDQREAAMNARDDKERIINEAAALRE